jgi:hypothetical protein
MASMTRRRRQLIGCRNRIRRGKEYIAHFSRMFSPQEQLLRLEVTLNGWQRRDGLVSEEARLAERMNYLREVLRPMPPHEWDNALIKLERISLDREDILSISVARLMRKELWPPDGIPPAPPPTRMD